MLLLLLMMVFQLYLFCYLHYTFTYHYHFIFIICDALRIKGPYGRNKKFSIFLKIDQWSSLKSVLQKNGKLFFPTMKSLYAQRITYTELGTSVLLWLWINCYSSLIFHFLFVNLSIILCCACSTFYDYLEYDYHITYLSFWIVLTLLLSLLLGKYHCCFCSIFI